VTFTRWAARRLLLALPVIAGITVLTFFLIHLAPGDPLYLLAGDGGSPAYYAEMRAKFALDRPLPEQFATYARALVSGDFGYSFTYEAPVIEVLTRYAPASVLLGATALALSVFGGALLATLSVMHRSPVLDSAIRAGSALMYSAPVYWTGQVLILVVAVKAGLLPVGGLTTARETLSGAALVIDVLQHLILPAVTLAVPFMAVIARVARAALIDVMEDTFICAARARGLSPRQLLFRHAWPQATASVMTLAGQYAPQIIGGAAFTEYLFGWPGLGNVVLHAALHRDYPLVTSAFLFISIAVVFCNAAADAVCAWLDPRVRLA